MSNNKSSNSSCSCLSKNSKVSTQKTCKAHNITTKKVISSKKIISHPSDSKSCSTSVVETKKGTARPKKSTKSEAMVTEKAQNKILDFCKKCGDEADRKQNYYNKNIDKLVSAVNVKSVRNDNAVNKRRNTHEPIKQYYKNENFLLASESMQLHEPNSNKGVMNSLGTIKEIPELRTASNDSIFMIYSDSDDDVTYLDIDDSDSIQKLIEFRNKNYFECHSAKSRIKTQPSVTRLNNHKCVYRFYLNDRLFPVPLNTDYNNKIRCVECHLPMDIKRDSKDEMINGTIQAKVKLGKETQDMILLLPIKESLIIEERRKEERKNEGEYVYFGVVKLSSDGNSIFNKTLPQDSLALKYQKGYKELQLNESYKYKRVEENDVIVI